MRVADQTRRRHRCDGFSLIELIVVLIIMGIVSTIAIPRYAMSAARYRGDAAAARVAADLEFARRRALATSTEVSVAFDLDASTYIMPSVPHPGRGTPPYLVDLTAEPYGARLTAAGFDVAADGADDVLEIIFDGYGVPDSGGSVSLSVGGAESRQVTLDEHSGRAVVQ